MIEPAHQDVVPVELASDKRETAARTLRPKLLRLRDDYLRPLRKSLVAVRAEALVVPRSLALADVSGLLGRLDLRREVAPVARFRGGTAEARRRLRRFLRGPLERYGAAGADPAEEQVSFLAAYLHFGQISPVEIALAVARASADQESRAAYLEELIMRRELAINFVEYEPRYDAYECVPHWARRTLAAHRRDPRPHRYGAA